MQASRGLASLTPFGYGALRMAQDRTPAALTQLAELRERVRALDERVTTLGRHL